MSTEDTDSIQEYAGYANGADTVGITYVSPSQVLGCDNMNFTVSLVCNSEASESPWETT